MKKKRNKMKRKIKKIFSAENLPALLILAGISIANCLWAGVHPVGFAVLHVTSFSALALSLRIKPIHPDEILFRRIWVFGGLFLLYMGIDYLFHPRSAMGRDEVLLCADILIVLFVAGNLPRRGLKYVLYIYFLIGIIFSSLHVYFITMMDEMNKTPSAFRHAYHFGIMALLIVFPAMGAFLSKHKSDFKDVGLFAALVSSIYLFVDVKSAPVLVFIPGTLLFIFFANRKKKLKQVVFISIAILCVLILSVVFLSDKLFQDLYKLVKEDSWINYHLPPMTTAIKMAMTHFFFGVGPGNFPNFSGRFARPGIGIHVFRAHNSLLELFTEVGFLGMMIFAIWMWYLLKSAVPLDPGRALSRWIHYGIHVSILLVVILSFVDFGLQMPVNLVTAAFLVGLLLADRNKESKPVCLKPIHRKLYMIPSFIAVLLVVPLVGTIYFERAKAMADTGRYYSAEKIFKTALLFSPGDDRISAAMAETELHLVRLKKSPQNYRNAMKYLTISLNENPEQAGLLYARSAVLEHTGEPFDPDKKLHDLEKAVELDPANVAILSAAMEYFFSRKMDQKGDAALDRLLKIVQPTTYHKLADYFIRLLVSEPEFKNRIFKRWALMKPGLVLELLKETEKRGLTILFHEIVDNMPDKWKDKIPENYLPQYAALMFQGKMPELAMLLVQSGLEHVQSWETKVELLEIRGDYYRKQGQFESAISDYDAALKEQSENVTIHLKRIHSLKALNRNASVVSELRELSIRFPDDPRIHRALASEFQKQGASLEALYEYRLANSLTNNSVDQEKVDGIRKDLHISDFWRDSSEVEYAH